ncbi:AAA family ATPase [Sinorhizobium sp. 8-89]|uniref:AAA family ATPase n=1 Tax=Sinorhizobium sp. 7-81 TaxID=3049087 RepID=UPI0024C3D0B9|nr:AAA family ATPase [Sinorhizobium sp. 7-81]
MRQIRLIVTAGLPGSGKSIIAEGHARAIGAPVLSVDPIEAAMWRSDIPKYMTGIAAYEVAAAVAEENLKLGLTVIVDAVNPVEAARATWVRLSKRQKSKLIFVEAHCSDEGVHRKRIENRVRGITGMPDIPWERVEERRAEYEPWSIDRITIDTATKSPEALVQDVLVQMGDV